MKKEDLIDNLAFMSDFLKKNEKSIDWIKIEKDITKLNSNLKKYIIPSNHVQNIFTNKSIFPNLNEIKNFTNRNLNLKISGNSKKDILSQISYYCILDPNLLLKIDGIIDTFEIKQPIPSKRKISTKKKGVIDESWEEWTKFEPDDLEKHLNNLTIPQIKSISGSFLSSSEKKGRKVTLIENIIRKIEKLKAKYEMGPG